MRRLLRGTEKCYREYSKVDHYLLPGSRGKRLSCLEYVRQFVHESHPFAQASSQASSHPSIKAPGAHGRLEVLFQST